LQNNLFQQDKGGLSLKKLLFVVIIFFILTACQPVDTTLPNASKKPGDIYVKSESPDPIVGDYVTAGPLSYVVTNVEQQKYISINGVDRIAKKSFVIVNIGITNRSSKPIVAQPEMFRLVDDKGNISPPVVTWDQLLNNKGKGFFHRRIEPTDRTNATLLFDTSLEIGKVYLEVSGGPLSFQKATIKLLK
jgi:hypothetical protein